MDYCEIAVENGSGDGRGYVEVVMSLIACLTAAITAALK